MYLYFLLSEKQNIQKKMIGKKKITIKELRIIKVLSLNIIEIKMKLHQTQLLFRCYYHFLPSNSFKILIKSV
jgi:hypothetical protein